MVNIEGYDSENVGTESVDREILKLGAGQRIRNVEVVGCMEGVSDYGEYTLVFLKGADGEELSLLLGGNVFGRNGIKALTTGEAGSRVPNAALLGRKIWIGKSNPTKGKAGKTYYNFQFGTEEDA